MLDTKGPEIRTGLLEGGKPVHLVAGQELTLSTDYSALGNSNMLTCSYAALPTSVRPGQTILAADGTLSMTVISCGAACVVVRVSNAITIGEKKNMNLPGVIVDLPTTWSISGSSTGWT